MGGRGYGFPVIEQFDPRVVGQDGAIGARFGDVDCDIAGMADAFGCTARRRDQADMIGRVKGQCGGRADGAGGGGIRIDCRSDRYARAPGRQRGGDRLRVGRACIRGGCGGDPGKARSGSSAWARSFPTGWARAIRFLCCGDHACRLLSSRKWGGPLLDRPSFCLARLLTCHGRHGSKSRDVGQLRCRPASHRADRTIRTMLRLT